MLGVFKTISFHIRTVLEEQLDDFNLISKTSDLQSTCFPSTECIDFCTISDQHLCYRVESEL